LPTEISILQTYIMHLSDIYMLQTQVQMDSLSTNDMAYVSLGKLTLSDLNEKDLHLY